MEYKVITMRAFRSRLKHYMALIEDGYNFEVNGVLFGEKSRNDAKSVYTEEEPRVKATKDVYTEEINSIRCEMCGKDYSQDVYIIYDDSGERNICKLCVANRTNPKLLESTLRKMQSAF